MNKVRYLLQEARSRDGCWKVQYFRWLGEIYSSDLLHSMVIMVNNNVLFKISKLHFKCSYHKGMINI
jgi:hypothetical protein